MRYFPGITSLEAAMSIDPTEAAAMIIANEEIEDYRLARMLQAIFGKGDE